MPMVGPTWYFANNARCAAASMMEVLHEFYGGEPCSPDELPNAGAEGKFIFTGVRNPYDRCLGVWWSLVSPGDRYGVKAAGMGTPIHCIRFLASGGFARSELGFHGHCDCTCSDICRGVELDAVVHYETLLEDFNKLPFVTREHSALPHLGRKSHGGAPRWPLADPAFRRAVEDWCAEDFQRFGYVVGEYQ